MKPSPLTLNLAAPQRRVNNVGLLLLLAGALLCAAMVAWAQHGAWQMGEAQAALDKQLRVSKQGAAKSAGLSTGPGKATTATNKGLDDKWVRAARVLARDLATPWADLLAALEQAQHADVALLVIEPSATDRSVRLTLEARHAKAMLNYLDTLESDPRLAGVMLLSHQAGQESTPSAVRFQLRATWGAKP